MKKHLPTLFKYLSVLAPKFAAKLALNLFATPERIPRPESEMDNFALARKFKLSSNKAQAFAWGNENNPVVLLIHGWNGRGTQMAFCQEALVKKGFQVIALDGPAHGDSPGKRTNPMAYAQFILKAQQELAPNGLAGLIAHSFGGGSSSLAVKLGLKSKALILVASPNKYSLVVDDYLNLLQLSARARAYFLTFIQQITGLKLEEMTTADLLKEGHTALMIAHDTSDKSVPYLRGQEIHEAVKGSILVTTENLGHRRILKSHDVIDQMANFIYQANR